jgi:cystathionine beta-lyase/cystathionine gamma-synthase
MRRQFGFSTTAIHGMPQRRPDWSPVAPAIQQSSTFTNPVGSEDEVLYSRYGNNPNQIQLARKYALLEGADDSIFVASGMGATALAHLAMLRPGDHLISSSWIYGGTQHLFDRELARFGIEVTYVNPEQPRHWRKAVRKSTRAIFVETPTNPLPPSTSTGTAMSLPALWPALAPSWKRSTASCGYGVRPSIRTPPG